MKTLLQRFDTNDIPMQTIAALSGAQLSEVSRLVSGRQKVSQNRTDDILAALDTVERVIEYFAPIRPDLSDIVAVRKAIECMEYKEMLESTIKNVSYMFASESKKIEGDV